MVRVLILTQSYVPDPSTTGQHLHSVGAALADRGHLVRVFAATRDYNDQNRKYLVQETRDGVEILRIP